MLDLVGRVLRNKPVRLAMVAGSMLWGTINFSGCGSANVTGPNTTPAVNKPPIIYSIPEQKLRENNKEYVHEVLIQASDPDNDPLSWEIVKTGILANLNVTNPNIKQQTQRFDQETNNYTLTLIVPPYTSGSGEITVKAYDGKDYTTETFKVDIAKNQSPPAKDINVNVNEGFNAYNVEFTNPDPEGDATSTAIQGTNDVVIVDLEPNKKRIIVENKDLNGNFTLPITRTDDRGATSTSTLYLTINPMADYKGSAKDVFSEAPVSNAKVSLLDSLNNTIASTSTNALGEFNLENTVRTNSNNTYTLSLNFEKGDYLERKLDDVKPEDQTFNEKLIPTQWANQTFTTRDGKTMTREQAMNELLRWNYGQITKFSWNKVIFYTGSEDLIKPFSREKIDSIKSALIESLALYAPEKQLGRDVEWIEVDKLEDMAQYSERYFFGPAGLVFDPKKEVYIISGSDAMAGSGGLGYWGKEDGIIDRAYNRFSNTSNKSTEKQEVGGAIGAGNGNPSTQHPKPSDDPYNSTVYDEQYASDEFSPLDKDLGKIYRNRKPGKESGIN